MTEFVGYYNGEWMPMDRIKYDPSDLGPSKGDQVFETIRTFGGASFRMKEHVDRLYRSLKYVRIDPGLTSQEMLDLSEEGIEQNRHLLDEVGDFSISQLVTRGPGRATRMGGRPPERLYQVRAQYDLVRRQLRERPSRSNHADAELRRGGTRPEAEAPEPYEYEHSRTGGQRSRSRARGRY